MQRREGEWKGWRFTKGGRHLVPLLRSAVGRNGGTPPGGHTRWMGTDNTKNPFRVTHTFENTRTQYYFGVNSVCTYRQTTR